ncbi:cytochrome oxidase assembly protein ShyY1 [Paenibacillus castaneae]|uniref:hypothetical protein n=1 Tax=Paenibacillus castaneae TaxID=474957 RepID=UPI000C9C3EB3|nr:hypothetical protein [Paenibacillus castaneae]NIK77044.1 cytochrome oxidase assembly protein ShyY1 [Paenibacillus castaneae]
MKKNVVPITIFALSVLILGMGIWQLVLYIPAQLDMLDQAELQGTTDEQISDYYRQQFLPQVLTYIITSFGIAAILFAIGMLFVKNDTKKVANQYMKRKGYSNQSDDDELDDFFEEFEAVKDERRSE